ncbi:MAG TPA: alpha-amylase family glycosyl hydrolase [Thermomicrobiales bacterium]|nr:alpha-amylase family glycosyl hydrolase [Thermomicrobiales bacterium]
MASEHRWWQTGIVYQIYPRSFQDSNGDGIGDLAGITSRLDYVRSLGVDAIWISPIYPSPMADFGYDVSEYIGIEPVFGTLDDFDRLVAEAHARGLRVLLDWVPNHSSVRHPWFIEARSSRDNPRRDWYYWRDAGSDGSPPNNWQSEFGGPAWTWDEATGQYYYHAYLPQQPDLNWRNPDVQAAMLDTLRFWLDRGVDGFRIDALRQLMKDPDWRDNPPNPDATPEMGLDNQLLPLHSADHADNDQIVRMIRAVLDEYPDRLLIGELYLPYERLMRYYGTGGAGLHLPTNMHLIRTAWDAAHLAALIDRYERALPDHGWPNWVLGNHDRPRIASRIGAAQARVAAMLLLTLRGTPTLYYGDEIGMRDVPIPPQRVRDPWGIRTGNPRLGRDPERTPMQWDASPNAGFCPPGVEPWLPIAGDAARNNVAVQRADSGSMLRLYQQLIALRRREPALQIGRYRPRGVDGNVLAYEREHDGRCLLVLLNLGARPHAWSSTDAPPAGHVLLSTNPNRPDNHVAGTVALAADEGAVIDLT